MYKNKGNSGSKFGTQFSTQLAKSVTTRIHKQLQAESHLSIHIDHNLPLKGEGKRKIDHFIVCGEECVLGEIKNLRYTRHTNDKSGWMIAAKCMAENTFERQLPYWCLLVGDGWRSENKRKELAAWGFHLIYCGDNQRIQSAIESVGLKLDYCWDEQVDNQHKEEQLHVWNGADSAVKDLVFSHIVTDEHIGNIVNYIKTSLDKKDIYGQEHWYI